MDTFSALLAICAGIHRLPVNSPHKGQWRGILMLSLICACINGCVNNHQAGDLRRHRTHYAVTSMIRKYGVRNSCDSRWRIIARGDNETTNCGIGVVMYNDDRNYPDEDYFYKHITFLIRKAVRIYSLQMLHKTTHTYRNRTREISHESALITQMMWISVWMWHLVT